MSEITEKRSRFIGNIAHVESEQEALDFVKSIKKEYYDAKHSAYAYISGTVKRYSDDGE
ncbi:MAG: YigZ family protein, partial [Clostridia bacterium]|nr:YigZ family protein [Clostridia bacterium]